MHIENTRDMERGVDASSLRWTYFSPPSFCLFSEAPDMSPWRPNKMPSTSQTRKVSSFSIEAILSLGPGGAAQYHNPAWVHCGHLNRPLYPFYYQQPNGYNRVIFHGPWNSSSGGTFLQRSCRRIRTIYTDEQLTKLEEVFCKQRYMTGTEKMLLASSLGLTKTQIKVWFQNRRTRWRKSHENMLT
ncbi:hypothetical protein DPEC_G00022140 [Dallia pectoralis]|uniref:Uncharacterized protein n=1 Tax=Dallia pectoralis TaxID=75939 RepID=A0ACC2HHW3_DALPE|nr:hypothetical protein DPEC_G00022140 [Dallia pectoralis]